MAADATIGASSKIDCEYSTWSSRPRAILAEKMRHGNAMGRGHFTAITVTRPSIPNFDMDHGARVNAELRCGEHDKN